MASVESIPGSNRSSWDSCDEQQCSFSLNVPNLFHLWDESWWDKDFFIFNLSRFWDTPVVKSSSRELCYIILAGICVGYLCTFSLIAKPHIIYCYLQRLGIGLSPAMSYSALVTKVLSLLFRCQELKGQLLRFTCCEIFRVKHFGSFEYLFRWTGIVLKVWKSTEETGIIFIWVWITWNRCFRSLWSSLCRIIRSNLWNSKKIFSLMVPF